MRYIYLISILLLTTSIVPYKNIIIPKYDAAYVEVSSVQYKNEQYNVICMKRKDEKIKVKYFAAADFNGNNVYKRYGNWSAGKNIVLVSSGTYMDNNYNPVGLAIDNGICVNKTLSNDFDGLVIVYATGGMVASNLKDGDLTVKGGNVDNNKKLDIRGSAWDFQTFIKWAQDQEATVFQTHLLVYKNGLKISGINSSVKTAERRFLAVCKDDSGNIIHVIVNRPDHTTLYEGAKNTLDFLNNYKDMEVIFMINLDTGYQDVFQFYNKDGTINSTIKGQKDLSTAINLLAYYFE